MLYYLRWDIDIGHAEVSPTRTHCNFTREDCLSISPIMNKVLMKNEKDFLDFISLPEIKLGSIKFIFDASCQQIDVELFFDGGKGLFCENVRQPQINENFNYGLIGTQCFLSIEDISGNGMEHCRWSIEDYEEGSIRFYCENIWKLL